MTTVTFCFADQAGSTVQLERLGRARAKRPVRAVDAVNCAVVVQQQAARRPDDQALGVGVGIHTEEPLLNDEGGYFGVLMVLATRLCGLADAGQVLVSDVTRGFVASRRVHGFFAAGGADPDGIAEPVSVAPSIEPGGDRVHPPGPPAGRSGPCRPLEVAVGVT